MQCSYAGEHVVFWSQANSYPAQYLTGKDVSKSSCMLVQSDIIEFGADALFVVGLAAIGLRVLLMPDSAWDSAPGSADKPAARAVPHAEHVVGS